MASYLISDAPYAPWLSEVLATLEEHKIDRITIAAPLADGEVFTGYYNMNTQDKALLASNIQADAVLDAVCHNGQRIQQAWEDDEEGVRPMWQFITEYWAGWLCALIGGAILAAIPKIKALWDAVLALLHDRIYTECYRFMELGYITRDGLRNLNYLYKTYHVMGGNGTGTELYKRACALPIHD